MCRCAKRGDWVSEETVVQGDIAEADLAHTIPNKTEAAYRRGKLIKKRQALMQDWARFCAGAGAEERKRDRIAAP